jgi:hypothetical protein
MAVTCLVDNFIHIKTNSIDTILASGCKMQSINCLTANFNENAVPKMITSLLCITNKQFSLQKVVQPVLVDATHGFSDGTRM